MMLTALVNCLACRTQLDAAHSENSALTDRLTMLQQDIQRLEEDIVKKKYAHLSWMKTNSFQFLVLFPPHLY